MKTKSPLDISQEDHTSFFNLCAKLPESLRKTEFERQTQEKYTTTRADKIHNEDMKKIKEYARDALSMCRY
jgi:predicted Holliday junction resolvase-like endonuclease